MLSLPERIALETACSNLRNRANRPRRFSTRAWEASVSMVLSSHPEACLHPMLGAASPARFLCRNPSDLSLVWPIRESAADFRSDLENGEPNFWADLCEALREALDAPGTERFATAVGRAFAPMHPEVALAALEAFGRFMAEPPPERPGLRESGEPMDAWREAAAPVIRTMLERACLDPFPAERPRSPAESI